MLAKFYAPKVDNNNVLSIKGGTDMDWYDIYAIMLCAISIALGMGLFTVVALMVTMNKRFLSWFMKKYMKVIADVTPELEDSLK